MSQSSDNPPVCGAIARRTVVRALGVGAITASFTATAFGRPTMTDNTDAQIRRIYDRWHETIVRRDLDGLLALYAEDAIFETPAILVTLTDRKQGILRGKSELRPFFEAGFRKLGNELTRWYRTGLFFASGRRLTWEYPRETPQGDQVDLVEVMDVADGLICHHRVYWGWIGFQTLVAALNKPGPAQVEVGR
jgi:steroid Delta-isomerase